MTLTVRVIGAGRAGGSFAAAWRAAGVDVDVLDRHADVTGAGAGVDAVLVATPDRSIAEVAATIEPDDAAILHCSGATGLAPVAHHPRHGSIHPLMALPSADVGSERLREHGWFAVAGDSIATRLVEVLGGRYFEVPDDQRALYHATAAISANHLVALMGQVERLAAIAGVPTQPFFALAQGSLDDVRAHGAVAALTGPAARGDRLTLDAHRAALPAGERDLYEALVTACRLLAATHDAPRNDPPGNAPST